MHRLVAQRGQHQAKRADLRDQALGLIRTPRREGISGEETDSQSARALRQASAMSRDQMSGRSLTSPSHSCGGGSAAIAAVAQSLLHGPSRAGGSRPVCRTRGRRIASASGWSPGRHVASRRACRSSSVQDVFRRPLSVGIALTAEPGDQMRLPLRVGGEVHQHVGREQRRPRATRVEPFGLAARHRLRTLDDLDVALRTSRAATRRSGSSATT